MISPLSFQCRSMVPPTAVIRVPMIFDPLLRLGGDTGGPPVSVQRNANVSAPCEVSTFQSRSTRP